MEIEGKSCDGIGDALGPCRGPDHPPGYRRVAPRARGGRVVGVDQDGSRAVTVWKGMA